MKIISNMINDKKFKESILYTFIFGFIAHSFFYFNVFLSHDSAVFFQNDIKWQIRIGRFLHPLIFSLRGNYYVHWLVGFLAMIFISLSVYLIVKMLPIKSRIGTILTSAILITNSTFTCLNATYAHETDIYMISFFFAVLGVYLIKNVKKGWLLAPFAFFVSLGLYQSFLNVFVFLLMLLIYIDLLNKKTFKEEKTLILKYLFSIICGLILYYIGMKISMKIFNVYATDGYNGLASVGNYGSIKNFFLSIVKTYYRVLLFLIKPLGYSSIVMLIANIVILISAAIMNIKIIIKNKIRNKELVLLIILIIFMPFGINAVCFISQGMEHELMIYSFFLLYVFAIYICEKYIDTYKINNDKKCNLCNLVSIMIGIIIYNLCIYSNQTYYIKENVYQNTLLTLNRIVYSIENLDGYEVGKTKVVFVGYLNDSKLAKPYKKYDASGIGTGLIFAVSGSNYYSYFIKGSMHINMNICPYDKSLIYLENDEVKEMKAYPSKDSIKFIDDVVVVKLSD